MCFFNSHPSFKIKHPTLNLVKKFSEEIINKVKQTKMSSHWGIIDKQAIINAEGLKPSNQIRDFKIGHFARLGRLDRCHVTQNTCDLLPSSL